MSRAARSAMSPLTLHCASLVVLRRDDELVELLRRREPGPEEDRVARLFKALLAEVDSGRTCGR